MLPMCSQLVTLGDKAIQNSRPAYSATIDQCLEPLFVQVVWDNILDDGSNETTWESVENCENCASLVAAFVRQVGLKVAYYLTADKDVIEFQTSEGGCFSCRHDLEPEVIKEMFPDFKGI
jgi:hypothetical protein